MTTPEPAKPWQAQPAVCEPLDPVERITGQRNMNDVWAGDVLELRGPRAGATYHCIFKRLTADRLSVELACAAAGTLLGNDVPRPCLVWADPAQLATGATIPPSAERELMFGSAFITQDAFFEHLAGNDHDDTLSKAVWSHFCNEAPRAAKGAAFDELVANWDRHMRNLRFDGSRWWLIDHDNALLPLRSTPDLERASATFKAHANLIAAELATRRRHDHDMVATARRVGQAREKVQALAAVARGWSDPDPAVQQVLQRAAQLISVLARRMPMLEQMVDDRIGARTSTPLQWTPPKL